MTPASRFAIAAFLVFAAAATVVSARAQDIAQNAKPPDNAGTGHVCLDQKERRAEADNSRLIRLAAAMRSAKSRMPGTVVRARLCHGPDGLVYVLTVLAHDGKVARLTVDATSGTLVGER